MPVSLSELQRAGALKRSLVAFSLTEHCKPDFDTQAELHRARSGVTADVGDTRAWADFIDTFLHNHRFADGTTVIDRFLALTNNLSEWDRETVAGWKSSLIGVFALGRRAEDTLVATNLIDELPYHLRSNQPGGTRQFLPGTYLVTRVVPLGDEWMMSGIAIPLAASEAQRAYDSALQLVTGQPSLAFRNPELRERSRAMQAQQHELFIELFGSDTVIVAAQDYPKEATRFNQYVARKTAPDEVIGEMSASAAEDDEIARPEWLDHVETVGMLYDAVAGPMTVPDYALLQKAFAEPDLGSESPYRETVLEYVEEADIPSTAFRRLAAADPAAATKLLQLAYEDPDLTWEADGERLLRDNRGRDDVPADPVIPIVNDRLLRYALGEEMPQAPAHRRLPGRNDPCICGSGRKYKHCCGR